MGIIPARWQAREIDNILRHDKHGDLISRVAIVSCARQNGKSVIVRIIVGWILDEGRLLEPFAGWPAILAAAHDVKQARVIYEAVYGDLASIPRLVEGSKGGRFARVVKLTEIFGIRVGGLSFDTVTSQPGSVRGKSAGMIAFDEVLTQRDWSMWEALSPVTSAQRSPLTLMTSTAGTVESVVLRSFYDKLVRIATGDSPPDPSFYGSWYQSIEAEAGYDRAALVQANPGVLDGRPTWAAIKSEYDILPPDSWRRERLNHWSETSTELAIDPRAWHACQVPTPLEGVVPPYALGIDVDTGWTRATIAAAAIRPDGRVGVEVYRDIREDVTVDRLLAEVAAFPEPVRVIAYAGVSGAASGFRRDAEQTARPWDELTPGMVVSACMDVAEMIGSTRLAVGDPLIDAQRQTVAKRDVGQDGAFRFSRKHSTGPIDAFMAMTFAAHAAAYAERPVQIFF